MSQSRILTMVLVFLGILAVPALALRPAPPPTVAVEEPGGALSQGGGAASVAPMPQDGRDLPLEVWVDPGYSGGGAGGHTWGVDAFATIQNGVNGVAAGGTVHVAAGSYYENITVAKTVTIDGAGAGSTFVYPAISAPGGDGGPSWSGSQIIAIQAHNVTISHLTVDGDNPGLTSGVIRHGADIDARNGIIEADGPWNGTSVHDCTVKNIYLRAIYARSGGAGFDFSHNVVQNVAGGPSSIAMFAFGSSGLMHGNTVSYANDALSANWSKGIIFEENVVTYSGSGVHTDNNGGYGGTADIIRNNHVSECATNGYGVWVFFPYVNTVLTGNVVEDAYVGLFAWGGSGGVGQFTNNSVDGGSIAAYVTCGPDAWLSWQANVSAYFAGNTLANTDYGFIIESDEAAPFFSTTVTAGSPATVFTNVMTQIMTAGLGPISVTGITGSPVEVASPGKIQTGIDLASAGGVVTVGPGVYAERIVVNKPLSLRGAQYGVDPTASGARTNPAVESTIDITGIGVTNPNVAVEIPAGITDVSVAGFRILGSPTTHYSDEAAIRCWDDRLTLQDNILDGYFGVVYKGNDYFTCSRNRMVVNKVGITVQPSPATHVVLSGNRIGIGSAPAGDAAGIYLSSSDNVTVTGNVSTGFPAQNGIGGSGVSHAEISGNNFSSNNKGVNLWGSTSFVTIAANVIDNCTTNGINIKGDDLTIHGNEVRNCAGVGIKIDKHVLNTERVVISGNDVSGNAGYALEVTPAVVSTVNASGNWWGMATPGGVRAKVSGTADYTPWLAAGTDTGDPGFQGDYSTLWVDDDSPQTGATGRLQEAIGLVSGSTIHVAPGTYTEPGQIVIDKTVTILGDPTSKPVFLTDRNTGSSGDPRGWWLVQDDKTLTLRDVVLDGTGYKVWQGLRAYGGGTLENCVLRNIQYEASGPAYAGTGIATFGDHNWTLRNNVFQSIGRVGVLAFGAGITNDLLQGNVYTGKGPGNWLDYGIELGAGAVATLTGNQITNCQGVASVDGSTSAAVLVSTYYGPGTTGTITSNLLGGNATGIGVGYDGADLSTVVARYNDLSGNTDYGLSSSGRTVDAILNWWGSTTGPQPSGSGSPVSTGVSFDPWIGKSGSGNIVFVPDREYFTTGQAKTLTVRYLGGASGPLYSWQIRMNGWSGAIVDAVAADVAPGDVNWGVFFTQNTGAGDEITVTGSLVGNDPGLTGPCDLFRVTFHGVAQGECLPALTATYFRDRNFNNLGGAVTDPGDLVVDGTAPAVSAVALTNVTLTGITNDYCKNGDVLGLTATVTDGGDPYFGAANITANLTALGGGAAVHPTTWSAGAATWANFTVAQSDPVETAKSVTITATDGAGQIGTGGDSIILDNIKPAAVTATAATPGHKKVTLAWTNGSDTYYDGVEIRYNVWQGTPYWLYQGTTDPGYPADQTAGLALWAGAGTGYLHTFTNYDRGIYEYTIVARDRARNYSVPADGSKARATNYWLGDVAPYTVPGTPAYDGCVGTADISALGNTYYATSNMECDVARLGNPNNPRGIPAPDGAVDFEDLMIFALNYGVVAPLTVPPIAVPDVPAEGSVAFSIQLPDEMSPGGEFEARVMLADDQGATQGARFVVAFDPNVVEYLGAAPGALVSGVASSFFMPVVVNGRPDISAASLGEGVTFGHSGELARLRFRCLSMGAVQLELRDVLARNARNEDLVTGSSSVDTDPTEVKLPAEVFLRPAQPNPVTGSASFSFGLPASATVKLAVYDVGGRLVRVLASGSQAAGEHPVVWNGQDEAGNRVAHGLYFYRLETTSKTITRKLIVTE